MIEHLCTAGMFMCAFDLVLGAGCAAVAVTAIAALMGLFDDRGSK